jgi:hypothetical protein
MKTKNMLISGWKTPKDWLKLRTKLIINTDNDVWEKAYKDYFLKRINLRYLHPIQILQENGTFQGEGFSIMTILCSLAEFLETTIRGLNYRYVRNERDLKAYEYCKSKQIFCDFLKNRIPFSNYFTDLSAKNFYENVRCGLLHEARTKNGWTIWAISPNGSIVDIKKKIIYRDDFRKAFDVFIQNYKGDLKTDVDFQAAFIRKFNSICEVI